MSFRHHVLDNGLEIIGEQREAAESLAIGFFVRTGARDESVEVSGVSHFLEHMMFKGTAKRSALDITYGLGALGAQANAFTSEENTVYYLAVLPEYFIPALGLLSDMLRPALDQKEFDTEKKVILEEIALYQDRPTHLLFEAALKNHFGVHPAGNSVLGTTESISQLSREQMLNYFEKRYSPANMVLTVSGAFDWDVVIAEAEKHCQSWIRYDVSRDYPKDSHQGGKEILKKKDLQCAHLCLTTEGYSAQSENRYALQTLCAIKGDSSGSRAFWELVHTGLAETASIDLEDMDRIGLLYAYASCQPEALDEVREKLVSIFELSEGFTESELERAKAKVATRLVLQGESSLRRLMAVGLEWIYREEYQPLEDELDRFRRLRLEDINDVAQQFSGGIRSEVRLIPHD